MVALGQFCRNQRTAFGCRFYHNDGIAHARHNAVAADKVMTVGVGIGQEFGQ